MALRTSSGQLAFSLEPERRIFRVSELNAAVQQRFEEQFSGIWVAGEIAGCRTATSGHYYFALKDNQSQLKCALFKGAARFVKFKPQDGLAVLARGNLEVYSARGEYQLIIEALEPQGAGALQLAFEQVKQRLALEGFFDQARKRPLPRLPQRIGLVTSPAGAVIQDMLHVLARRFPGLHLRLYPAQVQGEGSVEQVCAGLAYFSKTDWAEVVIVARGGGSLEDLWTFNEEAVARAIAGCRVPVISAIGHETDFTIADFVADMRAPTPSAAAEIVICTRESLLEQIAGARARALQALRFRLLQCRQRLEQRGVTRAETIIHRAIGRQAQRVDELEYQMERCARRGLDQRRARWKELERRLQMTDMRLRFSRNRHSLELLRQRLLKTMEDRVWQMRRRLENAEVHLRQMSPLTVLARGYAIVQDESGHALRSAAETTAGALLKIRLHDGSVEASVTETKP
jgi:exodeoxyribonuclease VII large subunit